MPLRVVHVCHGRFHHFDLARQLAKRGSLTRFYTGYPRNKLQDAEIPLDLVHTFPWVEVPYMALAKAGALRDPWQRPLHLLTQTSLDRYVSKTLPDCDVLFALSGSGVRSAAEASRRGIAYVCDRGSAHVRYQDAILREEYARWGERFPGIDPRVIRREEAEYSLADLIVVPSEFALQSFLKMGVPEGKLRKVPYGVDTRRFFKTGEPDWDRFDVLFVGQVTFRKGVPDLLCAFSRLKHPRKRLRIAGVIGPEMKRYFQRRQQPHAVEFLGHVPQAGLHEVMSCANVMVLPSVEEGLALVQAQALACGCPVIGTFNTGATDLFSDGVEGFIIPPRDPEELVRRLQQLADDQDMQRRMREAALIRSSELGGWDAYGDMVMKILTELTASRRAATHASSLRPAGVV